MIAEITFKTGNKEFSIEEYKTLCEIVGKTVVKENLCVLNGEVVNFYSWSMTFDKKESEENEKKTLVEKTSPRSFSPSLKTISHIPVFFTSPLDSSRISTVFVTYSFEITAPFT